jgi:alpha-tubulin suppressor-like RCC1 family protein
LKPFLIYEKIEVQKIFCGDEQTFILQNGNIFGCGLNDLGQLGLGDNEDKLEFKRVELNHKVVKFHSNGGHFIVLLGNL